MLTVTFTLFLLIVWIRYMYIQHKHQRSIKIEKKIEDSLSLPTWQRSALQIIISLSFVITSISQKILPDWGLYSTHLIASSCIPTTCSAEVLRSTLHKSQMRQSATWFSSKTLVICLGNKTSPTDVSVVLLASFVEPDRYYFTEIILKQQAKKVMSDSPGL